MPKVACAHEDCDHNKFEQCKYDGWINVRWGDDWVGCPHRGSKYNNTFTEWEEKYDVYMKKYGDIK